MKKILILILSIATLFACNNSEKPNSKGESEVVKQVEPIKLEKKDVEPQTITLQEVSRIALVEAMQFITNAKSQDVDYSDAMSIYEKAKKYYDGGEYKKAQKLAVEVRQSIENILNKKD